MKQSFSLKDGKNAKERGAIESLFQLNGEVNELYLGAVKNP